MLRFWFRVKTRIGAGAAGDCWVRSAALVESMLDPTVHYYISMKVGPRTSLAGYIVGRMACLSLGC